MEAPIFTSMAERFTTTKMAQPKPRLGRPYVYPKGSRVPFNAKIDKAKKELIENNLSAFGVTTFTEWLNLQIDNSVNFIHAKGK